jgi:1,4-dihydroxy-6-naphthoate synthase
LHPSFPEIRVATPPVRRLAVSKKVLMGFSFCPNDTFIFGAIAKGFVKAEGLEIEPVMADVEELNSLTMRGELEVSKISAHTLGYVLNSYLLLNVGGALGEGCGPLIVARPGTKLEKITSIAVPGLHTTATLLLRIFFEKMENLVVMRYDEIMPAVERGFVEAGLIIHEGRFTYPQHGLVQLADLGEVWERETRLPIPLGGIVAKRELGREALQEIEKAIRQSLQYAYQNREEIWPFVKEHAQEMEDEVVVQHIDLYVNQYTKKLGDKGRMAVERLLNLAQKRQIIPKIEANPFLD